VLVLFPTRGGPERFQRFLQIHVAYRTASIRPQEVYICPFFLACSPTSSRVDTRSFDILHPPASRSSVLKSSRCLPNTPTSSPSAPSLPCSRHTTTVPVCCFDQRFDHLQVATSTDQPSQTMSPTPGPPVSPPAPSPTSKPWFSV
jgi:hypothetical protein